MDERRALEARMAALTGQGADAVSDPRYRVAPMADRLRELRTWSENRDRPSEPAARVREPGRLPDVRPAELRPTPGEAEPATRVPVDPSVWLAGRAEEAADRRARERDALSPLLRPLDRALDARLAAPLDRAERRLRLRDEALTRARRAIPSDWEERLAARIPGAGRDDSYVRRRDQLLGVDVGSVEQLGRRSGMLRDPRELIEADQARDEARRERALERLKARRSEGA